MGNKILGKRSRSFYKGFNDHQVRYIKQKFSTISKNNALDKELLKKSYQLTNIVCDQFYSFVDFDQSNDIDEYQFICAVHTFCNMTVTELAGLFYDICVKGSNKELKQNDLFNFTQICLKYNAYLDKSLDKIDSNTIKKTNKDKFKQYDFDKNGSISKQEFIKICSKDIDYKKWMFNMGFITKNQLQFNDQIYDLIDSDIDDQLSKHLAEPNPNIDKIKSGIQHRIDDDEFQVIQEVGVQSIPVIHPWLKTVSQCKLDATLKQNPSTPSQCLTMTHVFGYRSYDCRNNIKFDDRGNLVYHQGSVGIVMIEKDKNKALYKQNFMNQHNDDISCLQVVDNIAITGQLGSKPSVMIWATDQLEQIKPSLIITANLKQSVGNIAISKSKKLLAVNCNDPDHSIVIYDINMLHQLKKNLTSTKTGVIASGCLSRQVIFDLKFTSNQKLIVAATLKQLLFVSFDNSTPIANRGEFNNFSNSPALCLLPLETNYKREDKKYMLSGMANGSIYFWEQTLCTKAVSGHNGSVSALCVRRDVNSFISGDKSGKIIVWNQKLQKQFSISVPKTCSPSQMIVSLSTNKKKQLLIGTKSSTIYKLPLSPNPPTQSNIIICGHNQGHITGLSIDQSEKINVFYTAGQDQRLIKWQYGDENKRVMERKCANSIANIDFNHFQNVLAVGYENGQLELFNQNLEQIKITFDKIKNPDQQVLNLLKFNKDASILAVCYSYPKFMVKLFQYDKKSLKQLTQIEQKTKITAIDFQEKSSKFLRLNNEAYQYLVYDISKKIVSKIDAKNQQVRSCTWQTHSTILSPQTQGFKTQGVLQSDITCCQRSRKYRNVFLLGDKYSKIKLFNYPCKTYPYFNKYTGHSNSITSIQFNKSQNYVISIGGEEKSIILWKYDADQINNAEYFNEVKEEIEARVQAKGEEKTAVSITGQIKEPTNFKQKYNAKRDNKLPDQAISIRHVFGLRNQYIKDQVRNHCKFTQDAKSILFPTACLGVKMNIQNRTQQFFHEHKQDIVSMAVDSKRQLLATGQMAQKNITNPLKKILSIYVWSIETKKVLKKLDGFHTIAVVLLQFSPDGSLLFSVGNDTKNTYAVYDWKSGSIIYSGPVSGGKVNGICWKSETQFMTCGNDHVKVWTNGKGKQGKYSEKPEAMFTCAVSKNIYLTGSGSGKIYNWNDTKSMKSIDAHKGKVQIIVCLMGRVFSGGDDGIVLIWKVAQNGQISIKQTFFNTQQVYLKNMKKTQNIMDEQYGVLSIDISKNKQVLIATKGASVIHFKQSSPKTAKIIHQGHYKGQLWALSTQPNQQYIISGGDDKSVRVWDLQSKEQVNRVYFKNKIRGLDWESVGEKRIVIADVRARIYLYDKILNKELDVHEGKPFKTNQSEIKIDPFVEDIKFSPDCTRIVYGTHAKSLDGELLSIQNNKLKSEGTFKVGTSAFLHVDWSRDSSSMAIATQGPQYKFLDKKGAPLSASSMRDEQWSTFTRKFGFQVKGIWQGVDYSDVNTVCRSPSSEFLAVGYDDQSIRLFKYPAYIDHQVHKTYYGHSSHVTKIKFNSNYMVSIGGLDRTIIVWNVEEKSKKDKAKQGDNDQDDGLDDIDEDIDVPNKAITRKVKQQPVQEFYEALDQGDQFMAVKPWLGAIKEPTTKFPKPTAGQPNVKIDLQYVFGYRVKDCRQNLFYSDKSTLIFHAAAVLIYHNTAQNSQVLICQHNDDILSIDYHAKSSRVITGQLGPKPLICLYQDGKFVTSFKAIVPKGVISLSISPDSNYVVCVGIDQDHMVAILDLNKKVLIAKEKGGKKLITNVKWVSDKEFVTVGINHFRLWNLDGKGITYKEASKRGNYVSIDAKDGLVLTGGSKGVLSSWKGTSPKEFILTTNEKTQDNEANDVGVIQCIKITDKFVACGTKSGFIVFLDLSLKLLKTIDIKPIIGDLTESHQNSCNSSIRSIDFNGNQMVIGTFGAQIYQIQVKNQTINEDSVKNIMKAHYSPNNTWTNEVWGLCISGDDVFTCSDDATLRHWSLSQKKLKSCVSLNYKNQSQTLLMDNKTKDYQQEAKGRTVAISPQRKFVVVGSKDGTVRVFKFKPTSEIKLEPFKYFKDASSWISQIKFAHNALIIGSHDSHIYVYNFNQQTQTIKRKYKPLKKHSSYITHIDVSRDSCFMQSTCGAYQLLFWDIATGKQITAGATMLRDQRWITWTCNLGWPVQGIYPKCTDGTFINAVDRSNLSINKMRFKDDPESYFLLAAGNDQGKVCVYNYPSLIKSSKYVEGKGHSSHVTTVRWSQDDQKIISVGGEDQCLMIWNVSKNKK